MPRWTNASRVSMRNPAQHGTGYGNELHTQLRSRTRSATTGFAVFSALDTRRGSLQRAELRSGQHRTVAQGSPDREAYRVGGNGDRASPITRSTKVQILHPVRRRSLHTVLSAQAFARALKILSAQRTSNGERPNVSDQMWVSTPHGAVALRSRYAAARSFCSSPKQWVRIPHSLHGGSSMVEHWTVDPEEWSGTISKMPICWKRCWITGPACCP